AGGFSHPSPRLETFWALTWGEGLGMFILVTVVGLFLVRDGAKWKLFVLAGFLGLLLASMFIGPYQPMRYHAGVILTLILTGAVGLGGILSRLLRLGLPLAVLVLIVHAFQCYRTVLVTFDRNPAV